MGQCQQITTPTALVLLGATGDLAQKKLIPSLFDLTQKGVLPEQFRIIAFARSKHDTAEYRDFVRAVLQQKQKGSHDDIERFASLFDFVQGDFQDKDAYVRIKTHLDQFDADIGTCTSKLFYLAVPPTFYEVIFEHIAEVDLEQPCAIGEGWTRILVEKPFGRDLENAQHLEKKLSSLFKEEQIYRIDHYLAKDAIQNILAFRFSNGLFEHNWDAGHIEAVYIKVFEEFGVETRGAFFDSVGALRDVGQNHMLQMLALVGMENPRTLEADALRSARTRVLQHLVLPTKDALGKDIYKGQYEGYRSIPGVSKESLVDTYFAIKAFLNTPRWSGVPFYLEHGKSMHENKTEVAIRFRSSSHCVCGSSAPHEHPNIIRFTISPEHKITIRFWVRKPGLKYELEPNDLVFDRHATLPDTTRAAGAYEEVLFDALCGDQTLFVSSAEQEAAWRYITTILTLWEHTPPLPYAQHSAGPDTTLKKEIEDLFN